MLGIPKQILTSTGAWHLRADLHSKTVAEGQSLHDPLARNGAVYEFEGGTLGVATGRLIGQVATTDFPQVLKWLESNDYGIRTFHEDAATVAIAADPTDPQNPLKNLAQVLAYDGMQQMMPQILVASVSKRQGL